MFRRKGIARLVMALALGGASTVVPGEDADTRGAPEEHARLYTNADLEPLEPPPEAEVPVLPHGGTQGDWEFVNEFLDREHARIDAERAHLLERQAADREASLVQSHVETRCCGAAWGWHALPLFGPLAPVRAQTVPYRPPRAPGSPHGVVIPLREVMSHRETIHGRPLPGHRTGQDASEPR